MKKAKILLKIILIAALVFGIYIVYVRYIPSVTNDEISKIQLKSNINRIARSYTNIFAGCEIWDETDKKRFKYDNVPEIDNITKDQIIISIGGSDDVTENLSFREVYGIFECWMFVESKKTSSEVVAICWSYTSGGIYTTTDKTTIITKSEFKMLYDNTDISGLTKKQAAKVLADKWIEETGYIKK